MNLSVESSDSVRSGLSDKSNFWPLSIPQRSTSRAHPLVHTHQFQHRTICIHIRLKGHPLSGQAFSPSPKIGSIPRNLSVRLIKRHARSFKAPASLGRSNGLVRFAMCIGRSGACILVDELQTATSLKSRTLWSLGSSSCVSTLARSKPSHARMTPEALPHRHPPLIPPYPISHDDGAPSPPLRFFCFLAAQVAKALSTPTLGLALYCNNPLVWCRPRTLTPTLHPRPSPA